MISFPEEPAHIYPYLIRQPNSCEEKIHKANGENLLILSDYHMPELPEGIIPKAMHGSMYGMCNTM